MSPRPFFTVVIPLYNKRDYVERALRSVLAQTEKDWELVLVDDGSTDGSGELVRERFPSGPIRVVRQRNQGISGARNRGIALSRSPYVAFLDADDEWLPDFLSAIRGLIRLCPKAVLYSTACFNKKRFRRQARTYRGIPAGFRGYLPDYFRTALGTSPVHPSCVVIPRANFARAGRFDPKVVVGEDTEMWFRLAVLGPVAFLNRHLAVYHRDAGITFLDNPRKDYGPNLRSIQRALKDGRVKPQDRASVLEYSQVVRLKQARTYMILGRREEARDLLAGITSPALRGKAAFLRSLARLPLPLFSIYRRVRKLV